MPTTSNGFPYPAASDAPDGPGGLFSLATFLESFLGQAVWAPGYGGGSGATLGSGGTSTGYVTIHGKRVTYNGNFQFGTSGAFGGGVATGFNVSGNVDTSLTLGTGIYQPVSGSSRSLTLKANAASTCSIFVETGTGLGVLSTIGTPASGDQVTFTVNAILA